LASRKAAVNIDPLRLSLEKAVGIPDAIHRSCTALATIVVRTISTSSVELIARDFSSRT
jgi:hypothetical protein